MELYGGSTELHGVPWNSMEFHGVSMDSMEGPWNSMEYQWNFVEIS